MFEEALTRLINEDADAIARDMISAARSGDTAMMRGLLDKFVRKPENVDDETGDTKATRLEVVFVKPGGEGAE